MIVAEQDGRYGDMNGSSEEIKTEAPGKKTGNFGNVISGDQDGSSGEKD